MPSIRNLKIGQRLALSSALLLVLIGGMALIGILSNRHLNERTRVIYEERAVPTQQLSSLDHLIQRNRILIMEMLLSPDRTTVQDKSAEFDRNTKTIDGIWATYMAQPQSGEEQEVARTLDERKRILFTEGLIPANQAMASDRYDEAADIQLRSITPLSPQLQEPLDRLVALKIRQAQDEFQASNASKAKVSWSIALTALAALLLGIWLSWTATRSITQPLAEAVRVADTVAGGDLTANIVVTGKDEAGAMLAALERMHDKLVDIVARVRRGSEAIATGSREISQSSADLAQRTEEQAINLERTAASMTEITSTVDSNAENARKASELAQKASHAATQGGEVVAQVVSTMEQISQSSHQIAEITGVIDGIAFQTNILALNAAVEAARAGEQGRGFAVVAAEVRSLAQRSAAAAREIKSLIAESASRVEVGSALVSQAGASVDDIVGQVRAVSQLIEDISRASLEQSASVSQISMSISSLDNMTQRNAALVEESAAAAESLRQQATKLDDVVRIFKIAA